MTRKLFKHIIYALLFNDIPPPYFKEILFEIHHVIVACNYYTKDAFIPSWVCCLYDQIYIWTKMFNYPGLMFVPGNIHPNGN